MRQQSGSGRGLTFAILGGWVAGIGAAAGCAPSWRPPQGAVQSPALHVNLMNRTGPTSSRRVYRRTDLRRDVPADTWFMVTTVGFRREGALADAATGALAAYLQSPSGDKQESAETFPWPTSKGRASGIFLLLDRPFTQYPRHLRGDEARTEETEVQVFGADGKRWYDGVARRTITCEGYETVTVDDEVYADCVRLRIETQVRISWMARVVYCEYVWLAAGVGEVLRLQRLKGRWLFFGFEGLWRYELLECEPLSNANIPGAASDAVDRGQGLHAAEAWRGAAIYLQPIFPTPTIAGAVIEFADGDQRAATVTAKSDTSTATSSGAPSAPAEAATRPATTR